MAAVTVLTIAAAASLAIEVCHWRERAVLRGLVDEIQRFKISRGRLPNVTDLAHGASRCEGPGSFVRLNRCVFYRTHEGRYIVGYSVGTDDDVYFDSATGQWSERLSPSWPAEDPEEAPSQQEPGK